MGSVLCVVFSALTSADRKNISPVETCNTYFLEQVKEGNSVESADPGSPKKAVKMDRYSNAADCKTHQIIN